LAGLYRVAPQERPIAARAAFSSTSRTSQGFFKVAEKPFDVAGCGCVIV
jgi:hypothetical protein